MKTDTFNYPVPVFNPDTHKYEDHTKTGRVSFSPAASYPWALVVPGTTLAAYFKSRKTAHHYADATLASGTDYVVGKVEAVR